MLKNGTIGWNVEEPMVCVRMPNDAYLRRGGLQYTREMRRFHHWIRSIGWSSHMDFVTGALSHAVVCIMPNAIRRSIYKRLRG